MLVLLCRLLCLAGILLTLAPLSAIATERPNIVLLLADDLGFSDLGCYGSEIATPNLDEIATGGRKFARFYNTGRCCPTRASLLTGLYPHQAGVGHMTRDFKIPGYRGALNRDCLTIAEVLRPAGYRTLMVGKWHVGARRGQWPLDRGFDRFFGCPTGGGFYFRETALQKNRDLVSDQKVVDFPEDAYITDLFTDYAIRFVDEAVDRGEPFFLHLAHIAPHWPLQALPEDIGKYKDRYRNGWDEIRRERFRKQRKLGLFTDDVQLSRRDPQVQDWEKLSDEQRNDLAHRMAVYAAQIDRLDQNVGRLVTALRQRGVWDNTVFIFLSDNGCSPEGGPGGFRRGDRTAEIGSPPTHASAGLEWANVCNTPYRKFKKDTFEGGVATPFIIHWKQGLQPRSGWERQVGHVIDLLPTCAELAGASIPVERDGKEVIPVEGRSLLSALSVDPANPPAVEKRVLFWEHEGNRAILDGDWKLVAPLDQSWRLFHLASDPTEQNNLAATAPDRVKTLQAAWQLWADRCGVRPWPVQQP